MMGPLIAQDGTNSMHANVIEPYIVSFTTLLRTAPLWNVVLEQLLYANYLLVCVHGRGIITK